MSLSQAKKQAKQLKAEHMLAPKVVEAVVVAAAEEMTLDKFMTDLYFPHATVHKRSVKRDDQLYRIRIKPKFGDLTLSAINRRDVQAFQNGLLKEGLSPASADHHVKLMRRVLNLAAQWELLEKNPLRGIELYMVDNQVENYLDQDQLDRLVDVLRHDDNRMVCCIVMFLLSTGARLNEALTATWKNINIDGGTWKVDAISSKSKKPRSIPLNDSALWVLEQLDTKGKSAYLFPSPAKQKGGKDEPYTTITRAWYRLRKEAKVPSVRLHDLRHSYASLLVTAGRSLYEVQQILGHSDPKVTMRYAHLSSKVLQEAANAASVIVRPTQRQTA
ncbi:site-specific integrase [Paucibacter sp. B2R-40]|uniref:site-specific integrase n=1 Tax=Paucibacter sp. B2R-40 TaxID=2893554 RepID=UPI0021E38C9A|nr:site-specific integrase [Paucibacter sp. B2R-40]MCV2352620.1 site-specific integrase [Paucibacter sp. B2R-40]